MRTLKGILWLILAGSLFLLSLSCRPVARDDMASRAIEGPVPAQVATPTRTPTSTPTATPTPTLTPASKPPVAPGPGALSTPRPTYPPNIELTVPPPPPLPPKSTFPPPRNALEAREQIEAERKEMGLKPGKIVKADGPTTAGATITIARKPVKLPDDAYIDSYIAGLSCGTGPCPRPPVYTIARGKSKITFSGVDGLTTWEQIAPGEEHIFDFLKDHLKAPPPTPTPAGPTGPGTRGSKVFVGSKLIQLPADAYVDKFISAPELFKTDDCPAGKGCPQTPVFGIVRGKSRIEYSAFNGELLKEQIAPGEANAFDFIRSYLKK